MSDKTEIKHIIDKIAFEFGVTFPVLSRPTTLEGAEEAYECIKNNPRIRNLKLI